MKKSRLSLLLLPLLLTSCIVGTDPDESCSASIGSSEPLVSSSYDFGSDPTYSYQREDASFLSFLNVAPYRVRSLSESGDGPTISLDFGDSWVDVEVIGQKDITSGMKGPNTLIPVHAYNDDSNDILLEGRKFPGVDGKGYLHAYIPEKSCRDPGEAFIRFISHPKDDLDAINGYALAVVYPVGEPVEVTSEEAGFSSEDLKGKKPGLVWLEWNIESVGDGVSFPEVNGEYQDIDVNRVNAALDIMCENARGHYFNRAQ